MISRPDPAADELDALERLFCRIAWGCGVFVVAILVMAMALAAAGVFAAWRAVL